MDLLGIAPTDVAAEYHQRGLDQLDDQALVTLTSRALASARTVDNSFTLHAPLELMARARLLPRVSPGARDLARLRLVALAAGYDNSGEPIAPPADAPSTTLDEIGTLLDRAVDAGDADLGDRVAMALAAARPEDGAELLADRVVPLLGGAGHAPIGLTQWPRTPGASTLDAAMFRHLFRNLAALGALRFQFPHPNHRRPTGSLADLERALAATPVIGETDFGIYALVVQAEEANCLATLPAMGADDVAAAFVLVLRRAATAMLTDDPNHAPYGWSHALTLPLALAQLAPATTDPTVALDAALTHWCGFRMAHGDGPIVEYDPLSAGMPLDAALTAGPHQAATAAYAGDDGEVTQTLIDNAATSHDAHLVKYTVAAFDAARLDPTGRRLYRAAAGFLAGWWRAHPPGDDPLGGQSTG